MRPEWDPNHETVFEITGSGEQGISKLLQRLHITRMRYTLKTELTYKELNYFYLEKKKDWTLVTSINYQILKKPISIENQS